MHTLLKKPSILFAMLSILLAACSKEEKHPQPEPRIAPKEITKANLVGSYMVSKVEGRTGSQRTDITGTWFSSYAGDCAKDDVTTFNPDNSFDVLDGTVACDESTNDTGTWELIGDTKLRIDKDTTTIEEFTDKTLRIVMPEYSNAQGDIIFTYSRQ